LVDRQILVALTVQVSGSLVGKTARRGVIATPNTGELLLNKISGCND
jgi:hypothetical protein